MSQNEKIIHLGRSKSPEQFKRAVLRNCNRQESPFGQKHQGKQLSQFVNTHPGFYSHSHKGSQDLQISFKENSRLFTTSDNFNQAPKRQFDCIIAEGSSSVNQKQDAKRKVQFLEARIYQLHHQKQNYLRKAHEQGIRLTSQNNFLKQRLAEVENINIMLLRKLEHQVNISRGLPVTGKPGFSNYYYQQPQNNAMMPPESEDNISINNYIDNDIGKQNEQYAQLQKQNQKLKGVSEENGKLNSLINSLKQEIKALEKKLKEKDEKNSLLNEQIQSYVQRLMQKSQQSMKIEDSQKQKLTSLQAQNTKLKESPAECLKCKEFIKALVKLNQKVYTGGHQNH